MLCKLNPTINDGFKGTFVFWNKTVIVFLAVGNFTMATNTSSFKTEISKEGRKTRLNITTKKSS